MWITGDVDLPAQLLDAHSTRTLVFFVGAGASMDRPSGLPSFKQLARDLAEAARVPFDESMAIDFFLGSMPEDFDTHRHARDLIARPDSTFNPTHSAVVTLAEAFGTPRVVTTNFDDHLRAAAQSHALPITDRWVGPALPLGDNFTGLVHLHGSVDRHPSELVLTDRDFGRAYLTDAWAARFLRRMFDAFTVLFVGYSHDDPIMRYLALGLPSRTSRFALTADPADEKWRHLGIVPVAYPAPEGDHSALPALLNAWNHRVRMGRQEHHGRMRQIVESGPVLSPVDEDYLRASLSEVDGAREFTRLAGSVEWLLWVESLSAFKGLFTGHPESDVGGILAQWFAQVFVTDATLNTAALQTVQRLGQRFSDGLYRSVAWAAEVLAESNLWAARRWKVLLGTSVEGISAPPELGLVLPYEPGDCAEHLALLRVAIRPYLGLTRRWFASNGPQVPPDAELRWRVDEHSITTHLLKLVNDADPGDLSVGLALEESLDLAYGILAAYDGERGHDRVSFRRSAIEPHPQDDLREPLDAVIDALRAYGEKALPVRSDLIDRWWTLGHSLFRRLALHLLDADAGRGADDKLSWVLDRNLLFEFDLKHEVYGVLLRSVPHAEPALKARLLEAAVLGTELPEDFPEAERHAAYISYNLLVWLVKADPAWADAEAAMNTVQEANPNFAPREHPDFDVWSSSGTWGGTLPMELEDFIHSAESDLEAAINRLLGEDYSERTFDRPTWSDALSVVTRASASRPDLGVRLWDACADRGEWGSQAEDMQRAVVDGWAEAVLGDQAEAVIERVAQQAHLRDSTRLATRFLVEQIEKHLDSPESVFIAGMRHLSDGIWAHGKDGFSDGGSEDPSFLALNSWPGDLARYWVTEINRRWREEGERWEGINPVEQTALGGLLKGPRPTLDAICPALASQTSFLFAADNAFAAKNIFPLFRESDTARGAWCGYLYHPRWNNQMLGAGFLEAIQEGWQILEGLERNLKHQFFELVASILVFGDVTAQERQSLLDRAVLTCGGAYAADFPSSVLRLLTPEEGARGSEVWELWLRDHVSARLRGLPRTAGPDELAHWADCAPFLGHSATEAFTLLAGHGIGLSSNYRAPDLPQSLLESDGPALVAHLAERIANTTATDWHVPYAIRKLLPKITEALGEDVGAPLWDSALKAGFVLERNAEPAEPASTDHSSPGTSAIDPVPSAS